MMDMGSFCVEYGKRRRFFHHRLRLRQPDADPARYGEHLLPQQTQTGKMTLVLDLDETLVYIKCARGCLVNCTCVSEGDEFFLSKRPGVDEFLRMLAPLYELVLWTAAPQMYADAALELLDPQNQIFSTRLYRQHLDSSGKKDLSRLGRDLSRVIAVDDCVWRFPEASLPNVIRIGRYVADGSPDDQLQTEVVKVLLELADSETQDVRMRLQKVEQGRLLSSQNSGADPWRPSWRRINQIEQQQPLDVIKVEMEESVYTPAPGERVMGEPSLLFGVTC